MRWGKSFSLQVFAEYLLCPIIVCQELRSKQSSERGSLRIPATGERLWTWGQKTYLI